MRDRIRRHPLATFYVLAYACSWIIAVPLALQAQGITHTTFPYWLHYVSAFGPAIAAFVVTPIVRHVWRSARPRRWLWWSLFGGASPLLLFALAQSIAFFLGKPVPSWRSLGQINFLPDLGLAAWLLWFMTSGCGEEIGWRGFALPRLQQSHSPLASSCLLAIAWAGWHAPAFFYVPSYLAMGARIIPGFLIGILAGSIVLTWLYNRSGGNLFSVIAWHGSFNFVTGSPNAVGIPAAVVSTLVIVWAMVVVWRMSPAASKLAPAS